MKLIEAPQYGPMFRFNDANVYWALHVLSCGKRMGRKKLSEEVGVGEGSMRRIIDTLKQRELIEIKQTGILMTPRGSEYLAGIPICPVDLNIGNSVVGTHQQSILVRDVADKINNGMEQRDAGIKVGAEGCTTILYRSGSLMVPPDWNLDEQNPELARKIREDIRMGENDVIIVGGGQTQSIATEAAVSAALALI